LTANNRRSGHTLIETMIALALISTVLTTVSLTLHTMYRANDRMRRALFQQRELDRLAAQLRTDAHVGSSPVVETPEEESTGPTLQLSLPDDQSVRYTLAEEHLERILRADDRVQYRERYRLPPDVDARWEVEEAQSTPIVCLILRDEPELPVQGTGSDHVHRIAAAVGILASEPDSQEP
jgi:type II secretory pathway component PulJ